MASLLRKPLLYRVLGGLFFLWNAGGIPYFIAAVRDAPAALVQMGMPAAAAALHPSLPVWMLAGFGIGVFGALLGCVLMALLRASAVPVLLVSLLGYVVIYGGYAITGINVVFAPPEVGITAAVLIIALLSLWVAVTGRKRGILR